MDRKKEGEEKRRHNDDEVRKNTPLCAYGIIIIRQIDNSKMMVRLNPIENKKNKVASNQG